MQFNQINLQIKFDCWLSKNGHKINALHLIFKSLKISICRVCGFELN